MEDGKVLKLHKSPIHSLQKQTMKTLRLLKGLGVEGDAHMGATVKHRSRVRHDPTQPNLRQVHLIHTELHAELSTKGFQVASGQMGENITTVGIDLLNLPKGTLLKIGNSIIQITGLRNPCIQLDSIQEGLMQAVIDKDEDGNLIRKSGVMGIIMEGGLINEGDPIKVVLPALPHMKLEKV